MNATYAQAAQPQTLEALLEGIDRGIEAHMAWNQRLLRCALLRESPGDEVLRPNAHALCSFGLWLSKHGPQLETINPALVQHIAQAHQSMHDAVRLMCERLLQGEAANGADLQAYEQAQNTMVTLLNALRERTAEASSHLDVLTRLPLRHGLDYAFRLRSKDARRAGAALWLAVIDVDHFKAVNDTHGHAVGDIALQHIARRLAACMRESDALFRFGGEEFLALLLVREPKDVALLAARLLSAVSAEPVSTASGVTLRLSVTIGLARVRDDEALAAATERADHAMLSGKALGRNRFALAPD